MGTTFTYQPLHFRSDQRICDWVCKSFHAKQQEEWHKTHKIFHPYCHLCEKEQWKVFSQEQAQELSNA